MEYGAIIVLLGILVTLINYEYEKIELQSV